ncbi:ABC transporter substrate-binding protein [Brenneria sp. g21c3]|uniref:ABC transporter substrate-binding protein n=1 Tax=Brenneria sp. g21c3 TaxID=3093893 RepID=UPI002E9A0ABE|nr:ABC transporter substrate-binding protein [Brenneria sp. g21c3]
MATSSFADVNIGLLGGMTGGTAAMAPQIMKAYDLAIKQVNEQGGILKGEKLIGITADDGCNPQLGADAASKVVNVSRVIAVAGPWCSGAVLAAANSVTIPAGVVLVTPAGTSPQITALKDNDLVFRTVASDEYQGQALARTLLKRGTKEVAVSFLNNDYGKGLAESFRKEFEAKGGKISGYAAHEENKSSYRTDLASLARAGADTLVIFDYADTSGLTVMREVLENDFFQNIVGGEGMKTSTLIKSLGAENLSTLLVSSPVSTTSTASELFNQQFKAVSGDPNAVFTNTGYDAVFMLALAIEKAKGDKAGISSALRAISGTEGDAILPGEWSKAKALIDSGKPIHYQGASGSLSFDANGDVPGSYALFNVADQDYKLISNME